jgi:DNA-binding response OmpR family regulator
LTPTEYQLLVYLIRHRGQVTTYDQLLDEIGSAADKRSRHRLFVHISRLREKIETDPKKPHFIQTQWGTGYLFLPKE